MDYKKVNNKDTDSLILSLENMATEYNNTLNSYNQVQQDLNAFANSQWVMNPYLNQNIQFTTGEIGYVTISGGVYMYEFINTLKQTISTDKTIQANDLSTVNYNESVVNSDQNIVNSDQNIVNSDQNTVNYYQNRISQGHHDTANLNNAENNLSTAQSTLDIAQSNLDFAMNNLNISENALNTTTNNLNNAENSLQNSLYQITESGCPSINNVTQINLPFLPEYYQLYTLIPTTPPLITMGTFTYQNGQIGYTDVNNTSVVLGQGCNNINANLTPPPYDIINIYNTSYSGNPITTIPNSTIEVCRASCYSTANCTGATFNSQTKNCTLSSGQGNLQPASDGITALVPQITQYLLVLSQLNFKLTDLNNQMVAAIKVADPDYVNYDNDNTIDDKLLKSTYTKLLEERKLIDNMINSIEYTQNEENTESIFTNTNYFKYVLLVALTIIVCIILIMVTKNGQNKENEGVVQNSLFFVIVIIGIIVIGVIVMKYFAQTTVTS